MNHANVRIEKDALGEVRVPADHLWGAQTQRSIENFPIGVDHARAHRRGVLADAAGEHQRVEAAERGGQ